MAANGVTAAPATIATKERLQPRLRRDSRGPLRVHPDNPRYFADDAGRPVYLTGAHTWNNLQDIGAGDPPLAFDFGAYLDFLERYHHNFIRLWRWELTKWDTTANSSFGRNATFTAAPHPWARTGPGTALDGKPKFDLQRFDADYFGRLRSRVAAARDRGIYVSVMLFEGWGLQFVEGGWKAHPFHPANNTNGLNADADGDGKGLETYTLASPQVMAVQEAYVRKVIETVGDLPNVLYEISNENHAPSTEWQYHMIRFVHEREKARGKVHPVGMTFQYQGGQNKTLFESPAEWVSPSPDGGYSKDPPPADGTKVVLSDTDHLWGIGGNVPWVWKSFLRGHNPLFMDPYDGTVVGSRFDPQWEPVRVALGHTLRLAERLPLAKMLPHREAASTGYCLADEGREYLVYQPQPDAGFTVTLPAGRYAVEWVDPRSGKATAGPALDAPAGPASFRAPFGGDAVLHLKRER